MARLKPGQLSYAQYMELLRLTSNIPAAQQILKNIVAPKADNGRDSAPRVPTPTPVSRLTLDRITRLTLEKITRADIERVLGQNLDNTVAYSFYQLADVQPGWNCDTYNGYGIWHSLADNKTSEKIALIMKKGLELDPRLNDARIIMQVGMTITADDFYQVRNWTRKAPMYDNKSVHVAGNMVFLTSDGRLVARNDAWWYVKECIYKPNAAHFCSDELAYLVCAYDTCRNSFVSGIAPLLKSDKQK